MENLKDITVDRLEIGETGVFDGVKYEAVFVPAGSCGDCDLLPTAACVGRLKCWTLADVDFMLKRVE